MNTDWMARGKCKEVAPDIFFPSDGMGVLAAQRIVILAGVAALWREHPVQRAVREVLVGPWRWLGEAILHSGGNSGRLF